VARAAAGPSANSRTGKALSEAHEHVVNGGPVVLDIGGVLGALVVYTAGELAGTEIEIGRVDSDEEPMHTEVHRRNLYGREVFAGVFAQIREGHYRFLSKGRAAGSDVMITGGSVTEVDWR
jgi:bifunctional ADP-heptose synthase (sugar kinase/adenylyltransferase)